MSLSDVIRAAVNSQEKHPQAEPEHLSPVVSQKSLPNGSVKWDNDPISSSSNARHGGAANNIENGSAKPRTHKHTTSAYRSVPSTRSGPPRSISYGYPLPHHSPTPSRPSSRNERSGESDINEFPFDFTPGEIEVGFRGVLDGQRDQEKDSIDRKGKKKESRHVEDSWNPLKWFTTETESPKEEKPGFDLSEQQEEQEEHVEVEDNLGPSDRDNSSHPNGIPVDRPLRRSQSAPHSKPDKGKTSATVTWGRLRSMLPNIANQAHAPQTPGPSAVIPQAVNMTDELITGGLSTLMLRLWFERDEKGHRRIPVLLHRLRIRVSDSLHPLHGHSSVFRIECEYANGAARWVVYRQLRDFFSLHTHYAISNAYNRNVDELPEFPRTSLPYFKFLKRESREKGRQVGHSEFARMQREVLENYLIDLIRAVMFHPTSNRLAGFLEISALSISLAQSGGTQYKAGFLRIEASGGKGGGFGRKSVGRKEKRESRWCAVRESYLVVLEQAGEVTIWDVFLLDSEFKIERPTRYYRQGLNLLHPDTENNEHLSVNGHEKARIQVDDKVDTVSIIGSVKQRISKALHLGHHGRSHSLEHATSSQNRPVDSASSSGSSSAASSRPPTPMLDPSTNTNPLGHPDEFNETKSPTPQEDDEKKKRRANEVSKHTFYIENAQMRLKLFARNERQMLQWITALEKVAATSHFTGSNRFDSFAPIRLNVAAQWLVDGRDYFWNLSRAILLARETIYIHDWWLSPELQMRRPNKDKYRLDRLLERKAREGVKIFIILYQEVSSRTTPTDSNYSKQRLTSLHPNVMVQRSPSHFQTGTFYWAHHEKMCVIDQTIAFMGGLDLCFGRWDTPQHVLIDDPGPQGETFEQIWPGKDYSNPRILDFHTLNKPEEDMYDRTKIPRMPWHDVGMQVVGQPSRDLARHFVERWNYLLRIKNHSRTMPFLLPPSEFKPGELTEMGLTGTCEMQICRSAGPWSLGTPGRIEHSIENAYLKAIQLSEHFVYIENQFFITSTVINDIKVENRIGDALVHRILRAHRERTPWKCCILIPILPGFAFPVDHSDASAIRIILECQNRTIFRGPNSIFSRLRKEGVDPDNYISVFSLRNWAKLRGDVFTTEQVYIHGKVCVVDDRVAIIGSANINERSQRGDRDSELAAVIRDTDMIDCTMAGKPFKVARFAHTLRVRLMREHIGVDVDKMSEDDLMANEPVKQPHEQEEWDPDTEQAHGQEGVTRVKKSKQKTPASALFHDTLDSVEQAIHGTGDAGSKNLGQLVRKVGFKSKEVDSTAGYASLDEERKTFTREGKKEPGFASSIVPTLEEKTIAEKRPPKAQATDAPIADKIDQQQDTSPEARGPAEARLSNGQLYGAPADASSGPETDDQPPHARSGINDADEEEQAAVGARSLIRKHLASKLGNKTWTLLVPTPKVDPNGFDDPVSDAFWKNVWVACAVHNTEIYRKVFHAIPDDIVTTWKQYKEFVLHHERLNKPSRDEADPEPIARMPSEAGDADAPGHKGGDEGASIVKDDDTPNKEDTKDGSADASESHSQTTSKPHGNGTAAASEKDTKGSQRRPVRGIEPFEKWEREEMEKLLDELQGHLVLYPNRFLEGEDIANNFLFNADRLLPLPIYD